MSARGVLIAALFTLLAGLTSPPWALDGGAGAGTIVNDVCTQSTGNGQVACGSGSTANGLSATANAWFSMAGFEPRQ